MKRSIFILPAISLLYFLTGCNQSTLAQELDTYRDCMQKVEVDAVIVKCRELIQEMSDKYAFDPEASEIIEKRLQDCASN